jgi:hypothetical protein
LGHAAQHRPYLHNPRRQPAPALSYAGQEELARDLSALRAAVGDADPERVFVCAVAPSGVGGNEYYRDEDEYLDAVADALHAEYQAIIDAGFTLQIDDPFLTEEFSYGAGSPAEKLETAGLYVDAINRSLEGIPRERIRLHTCYGINEGPRLHDAPLADLIDRLFTINAGAFSFEAANPRHEHSCHVFGAPGHDRRPHRQVRRGRRQGERDRQRRLRLLLPGHLCPRNPPEDRVGQARIASGRRPSRHGAALVAAR